MNCEIDSKTGSVVHHTERYADNWISHVDNEYNVKFIQSESDSYRNPRHTSYMREVIFESQYAHAIDRIREVYKNKRQLSGDTVPDVELFDDLIDDIEIDDLIINEHQRVERAISDYTKRIRRLHDETRNIRLHYMYQIATLFDSPIGHYMIHTHNECYRKFIDRFQDIVMNRNKCSEEERDIIDRIDDLFSKIETNNIYRIQWNSGNLITTHSDINYFYRSKNENRFRISLELYNAFMMECFAKYLVSSSHNPYRYTFQLYLYLNTPMGIYWSVGYPDNYLMIKNAMIEVIEILSESSCEKLYTYSNETNVKDDTAIIIRDIECLPYQTHANMKKIKYLQSFCKRNNQYFRFSHWIRSREFNEWFYAPKGIGGKMHMLHATIQLDSELNRCQKWIK
jgi:hypothetical protein